METNLFWELFRDTGDPICWLLARRAAETAEKKQSTEQREEKPSVPG